MELVLRQGKDELCIDHQNGHVGFTILTEDEKQMDFGVDITEWNQLKKYIDECIWDYENPGK